MLRRKKDSTNYIAYLKAGNLISSYYVIITYVWDCRLALAKIGEDLIKHPFDGDGMVMAISFSKEGAYFRNRFVSR